MLKNRKCVYTTISAMIKIKDKKYAAVNMLGIALMYGLCLLMDFCVGSNDNHINGLQSLVEDVMYVFPFVFYAIAAFIDIGVRKRMSSFGRYTRDFYWAIAGGLFAVGVITTIWWFFTGKVGTVSGSWLSWDYGYMGNFVFYILYAGIVCIIGMAANVYIWLISLIPCVWLKIRNKIEDAWY